MIAGSKYRTIEYLEARRGDESAKRTALADAHRIAEYLIDQCEATVFGIGSLFESGRVFGPHSDIDLVVEGIPPERFFSITAAAQLRDALLPFLRFRHLFRNLYGFNLDPRRLEELSEAFPIVLAKSRIEMEAFTQWLRETSRLPEE